MRRPKKKKVEEYIECDLACPWCDSEEVSSSMTESDVGVAWREMSCDECEAEWTDYFELIAISWLRQRGKRLERQYSDEVFKDKENKS